MRSSLSHTVAWSPSTRVFVIRAPPTMIFLAKVHRPSAQSCPQWEAGSIGTHFCIRIHPSIHFIRSAGGLRRHIESAFPWAAKLALSLSKFYLFQEARPGAFALPCVSRLTRRSIHRPSMHMERRAPLRSSTDALRDLLTAQDARSLERKRERTNQLRASSLTGSYCIAVLRHNVRCFYGPCALVSSLTASDGRSSPSPSSASSRERSFHSFFDGRGAQARASRRRTQSTRSSSLFGGLYHRYVRRRHRRRRHACLLSPVVDFCART